MSINPSSLRAAIEAEMVDRVRITRQDTSTPTIDDATGAITYATPPAVIYNNLRCLIDQMTAQAKTLAGFDAELDVFDLALPMSAVGIRKGDDLQVLASRNDADLVGVRLQIGTTFGAGTLAPTRRIAAIRTGQAARTAAD